MRFFQQGIWKYFFQCFCACSLLYGELPPDCLSVASGVYNLLQPRWITGEFDIEYKMRWRCLQTSIRWLELRPLIGVLGTLRGTVYAYGGINFDLLFFDNIIISPGFAAGYFAKGDGRDLGYPVEFRSGVELSWQFSDYRRLGVHFYHLSNASLGKRNPGEESLVFFYDIPLVKGFPFGTSSTREK